MSIRQRLQNNAESIINILLIFSFAFIISSCVTDRSKEPAVVTAKPTGLVICELPKVDVNPVWVTSKDTIENPDTYFTILSRDKCQSMGGGHAHV